MTENDLLKIAYQKALNYPELYYWQDYLKDMGIAKTYTSSLEAEIPRYKRFILPKTHKRERSNSCDFEAPLEPSPDFKRPRATRLCTPSTSSISSDGDDEDQEEVTASKRVGPTNLDLPERLGAINSRCGHLLSSKAQTRTPSGPKVRFHAVTHLATLNTHQEDGIDVDTETNVSKRPEFDDASTYTAWTTEEDKEIIWLREHVMPPLNFERITEVFNKKFSLSTRSRNEIEARCSQFLGPSTYRPDVHAPNSSGYYAAVSKIPQKQGDRALDSEIDDISEFEEGSEHDEE
jgi:hypothetical protein